MKAIFQAIAAACALVLCSGVATLAEERVTVFAAASLKDVLDEAAASWPEKVVVSYGGSGLIARQVAQGAPADLVVLANAEWTKWLAAQGRDMQAIGDLASNRLVLIAPSGSEAFDPANLSQHLGDGRLAIGNTLGVPAGIYARQWLEATGLWPQVSTRLAETENVRAALALVARKEALLGVVYASDALADPSVSVLYAVPPEFHDPIRYPMALLDDRAAGFARFLQGDEGRTILGRHGFLPPEDGS